MLLLPERLLIDQFKTVIYIDSIQLWPKMLVKFMKIPLYSKEIHDMTDTTLDVVSTSSTTADASLLSLHKQICLDINLFLH